MKRLWFNADDFGISPGVSKGIVEAMRNGVVGTTTAMVCCADAETNIALHADAIRGRIGLHLQLTTGRPRLPSGEVPSLVDETGSFPRRRAEVGRPDPEQVAREWRAQVDTLRGLGIEPTHLDSHHHIHMRPTVFEVYVELAELYDLPVRAGSPWVRSILRARGVRCADMFTSRFCEKTTGPDDLLAILESAGEVMDDGGVLEMMCHPGRPDEKLAELATYVAERERELETLLDSNLERRIADAGFRVVRGPADD